MHKNDYYHVLGVKRSASKDEIKRAFHKLARQYHPDNKDTGNEQKFKEVSEAYHTLSDDRKRAEYDSYGHVFSGGQGGFGSGGGSPFGGFEGAAGFQDFDIGDIFSEFFGGGAGRVGRGRDISVDLQISFAESVFGTERSVLLAKTSRCDACDGTGGDRKAGFKKCGACNGQGKIHESKNSFFGTFTSVHECGECHGRGNLPKTKCEHCRGLGVVRREEEISIKIPAGIQAGEVIRLSGMGEAIPNGVSGDLYIKVHVKPHPVFRREGNNLLMDLDIKLSDALLGAEYTVPTLEGKNLSIIIPAGASYNEILRVRGKGVPTDDGRRRGDLLVKLQIRLPNNLSEKARKLVGQLKQEGI